jgi:Spo0E like sporulation regulatory protein
MTFALNHRPLMVSTLMQHIHSLREQLIDTGVCEGLNHEKTIQLSQKLDEYIFLYQSHMK